MPTVSARWQDWSGEGLEHLVFGEDRDGVRADSFVIGQADGPPFAATYHVFCDTKWRTRVVDVVLRRDNPWQRSSLYLVANGEGRWEQEPSGEHLPQLNGAIDIDITATPFTNTLPIRRLGLKAGQSADIMVAYIDIPSLTVTADPQRYTCLEPMRRYRFESQGGDFVREIEVDEHGLVVLYPGLFRRVL